MKLGLERSRRIKRLSRISQVTGPSKVGTDEDWDGLTDRKAIKPQDQLELSEKELEQKEIRILKTENTRTTADRIVFSFKRERFELVQNIPQTEVLYSAEGSSTLKTTEDNTPKQFLPQIAELSELGKLQNNFNHCERAALTSKLRVKNVMLQAEPPVYSTFSLNVTHWQIYDRYVEDTERKEKEKDIKTKAEKSIPEKQKQETSEVQAMNLPKAKFINRMANLTVTDDIAQDFKYWEDPSDEFRQATGSLLPLWKFGRIKEPAITYEVTCLTWNSHYADLFAVGLGSYDFLNQSCGKICLLTLKCPAYPDRVINMSNTVCSIDFHPINSYLLAAGFYDGTVSVYDFRSKKDDPVYSSEDPETKHQDPVLQVKWLTENSDKDLNFASVGGDGRVINWIIVKDELRCSDLCLLRRENCQLMGNEGRISETMSWGTALSFNKYDQSLFIVGTEEGLIHKCSSVYVGEYLETYRYHTLSVYKLEWNPFHPKVFISCSPDWLVCIWDHTVKEPMFEFDLKTKVEDVAWAPYSSTTFAALTETKIFIYDLVINKYQYVCSQSIIPKNKRKANHVAFNSVCPIIIVGDNRGNVLTYKLSPNLRQNLTEMKNMDEEQFRSSEIEKLEKLLQMTRD